MTEDKTTKAATRRGNVANLTPMKKGETLNPKGSSAKARARKAAKDRLKALRRAVFGSRGNPEREIAAAMLADGFNADNAELETLMKADGVPTAIKVILKEAIVNPDFALKVFTTIYGKDTPQKVEHTGKDGSPLVPQPLTIEIIDSREQADTDTDPAQ